MMMKKYVIMIACVVILLVAFGIIGIAMCGGKGL